MLQLALQQSRACFPAGFRHNFSYQLLSSDNLLRNEFLSHTLSQSTSHPEMFTRGMRLCKQKRTFAGTVRWGCALDAVYSHPSTSLSLWLVPGSAFLALAGFTGRSCLQRGTTPTARGGQQPGRSMHANASQNFPRPAGCSPTIHLEESVCTQKSWQHPWGRWDHH